MHRLLFVLVLAALGCTMRPALDRAYDDFALGAQHEAAGDYRSAIQDYRRALAACPDCAGIVGALAQAYYREQDFRAALPFARRLVRLDRLEPNGWALLGNCYLQLGRMRSAMAAFERRVQLSETDEFLVSLARTYEAVGKLDAALAVYQRLIVRNPGQAGPYFGAAEVLRNLRRYREASADYQQVIALDSTQTGALLGLAVCADFLADLGVARDNYRRYLERTGRNPVVERRLLDVDVRAGQLAEALVLGDQLVRESPADFEARRAYGYALYESGERARALDQFLAACALAGRDTYSFFYAARSFYDLKDYVHARQFLDRALRRAPRLADAWTYRGLVLSELGQSRAAGRAFARALALGGPPAQNLYFLGFLSEREQRLDAALGYYQRALATEPGDVRVLYRAGVVLDRQGRADEAVASFRRVLEIDTANASAYNYIAYLYAERGEHLAEAESLSARALALEPENAYFLDTRGWIWYRLGRTEEARVELEKAAARQEDPTILNHLAEVYDALGLADQAQQTREHLRSLESGRKGIPSSR